MFINDKGYVITSEKTYAKIKIIDGAISYRMLEHYLTSIEISEFNRVISQFEIDYQKKVSKKYNRPKCYYCGKEAQLFLTNPSDKEDGTMIGSCKKCLGGKHE